MHNPSGGETIRVRVIYSGRVQGVCFRATAQDLARGHDIVGWVRNRADGTVELEAQGSRGAVDAFLAAVSGHFRGHIQDERRITLEPDGAETDFGIHF